MPPHPHKVSAILRPPRGSYSYWPWSPVNSFPRTWKGVWRENNISDVPKTVMAAMGPLLVPAQWQRLVSLKAATDSWCLGWGFADQGPPVFPLPASSELTKSDGLIVLLGLLFIALRVMDEFSEVGRRQGQWSLERGLSAAEWLCQHPVISSEEKKFFSCPHFLLCWKNIFSYPH